MACTTLEYSLDEMARHLEKDNALGVEINWFEFCGTTKEDWKKMMLSRAKKKWFKELVRYENARFEPFHWLTDIKESEVIGNIYENPELLK